MMKSEPTLFKLLNELVNFLHYLAAQFLVLIRLLFPWLGQSRVNFEKLNYSDPYARSFSLDQMLADFTFEVSSQGEFQQILEAIKLMLAKGKKVELIYASPSLENDITNFKLNYSLDQLRVLRLPIVIRSLFINRRFQVKSWVTSSKFGFVRYDFYPHLLSLCFKRNMQVYLFWGSLKNKLNSGFSQWFWGNLSRCFFKVYAANEDSQKGFVKLNQDLESVVSEMRTLAIEARLEQREPSFISKNVTALVAQLKADRRQKIILGSAYGDDLEILKNESIKKRLLENKAVVLIAPHSLKVANVELFKTFLGSTEYRSLHIESDNALNEQKIEKSHVLLFSGKGILCELYSAFDIAYVGGGFEKSIHSVLEPYWSGCHVICGPKTHRSTEYDFCRELNQDRIVSASSRKEVAEQIEKRDNYQNDFLNRDALFYKVLKQEKENLESLL